LSEDENPEPTPALTPTPTPQPLKIEILEKLSTLITAAFGFVAAFAWNETFKLLLHKAVEGEEEPIFYLIYAIIVTIVAVLLIISVARLTGKAKSKLQ